MLVTLVVGPVRVWEVVAVMVVVTVWVTVNGGVVVEVVDGAVVVLVVVVVPGMTTYSNVVVPVAPLESVAVMTYVSDTHSEFPPTFVV